MIGVGAGADDEFGSGDKSNVAANRVGIHTGDGRGHKSDELRPALVSTEQASEQALLS